MNHGYSPFTNDKTGSQQVQASPTDWLLMKIGKSENPSDLLFDCLYTCVKKGFAQSMFDQPNFCKTWFKNIFFSTRLNFSQSQLASLVKLFISKAEALELAKTRMPTGEYVGFNDLHFLCALNVPYYACQNSVLTSHGKFLNIEFLKAFPMLSFENHIEIIGQTGQVITRYSIPVREALLKACLLYTSPSPRDLSTSRMPSSA